MTDPVVSVIIPTHNRAGPLRRAIESVLSQEGVSFELIVVDDGSTDSTKDLLDELSGPEMRVLRHKRNLGGGAARNTGIRAARGAYIAFLDSDDEWLPGKLAGCVSFAEAQPDRPTCVVFHRLVVLSEIGPATSPVQPVLPGERVSHYLFVRRGLIQTSAVVVPTALAAKVLFDETLKRLQDWDFYLRLHAAGARFAQAPGVFTRYTALESVQRISSHLDYEFLLTFARQRRWLMSTRDYIGFLANKVAPESVISGYRLRGAAWLLTGAAVGVVPARILPIEVVRLCVPTGTFKWLRQRKRRLKVVQQ